MIEKYEIFIEICSLFKDEKEPKNLYLKKDFASHRSPIGRIIKELI